MGYVNVYTRTHSPTLTLSGLTQDTELFQQLNYDRLRKGMARGFKGMNGMYEWGCV